jgi:hypothetical protein
MLRGLLTSAGYTRYILSPSLGGNALTCRSCMQSTHGTRFGLLTTVLKGSPKWGMMIEKQ